MLVIFYDIIEKTIGFYLMLDERRITPEQCRGARAMLGMSRDELAKASGVANATLADFESAKRTPYPRTLADVRDALEAAGIVFLAPGESGMVGGAGVRLRQAGE
jgi:hypothetical protein